MSAGTDLLWNCPESLLSVHLWLHVSLQAEREWGRLSLFKIPCSVFRVSFPKIHLGSGGEGVGATCQMELGRKQPDEMPFFHMRTVAKRFVYALSWLDNPNIIKPASATGPGFCHCQSLWYSEEMLAQEGQQNFIAKCIWNPLSPLLEPLQNHSGHKTFFPSVVASQSLRQALLTPSPDWRWHPRSKG